MHEHVKYLFKWLSLAILVAMAATPGSAQTGPNNSAATRASTTRLDALVRQLMDNAGMPGPQAVVVKDGKIVWSGSYGDAVLDVPGPRRPMRNDSLILIASTSKILVAIGSRDSPHPDFRYANAAVRQPAAETLSSLPAAYMPERSLLRLCSSVPMPRTSKSV